MGLGTSAPTENLLQPYSIRGVVAIVLSLEISRAPRAPERFRALFRPCVRVSLIRMMDRI